MINVKFYDSINDEKIKFYLNLMENGYFASTKKEALMKYLVDIEK